MKNGDFPVRYVKLPEGSYAIATPKKNSEHTLGNPDNISFLCGKHHRSTILEALFGIFFEGYCL